MVKIKHERTADCVAAGYRLLQVRAGPRSGSLLLGLYAEDAVLALVGVIGTFPLTTRKALFAEMQRLVTTFHQEGRPATPVQGSPLRSQQRHQLDRAKRRLSRGYYLGKIHHDAEVVEVHTLG